MIYRFVTYADDRALSERMAKQLTETGLADGLEHTSSIEEFEAALAAHAPDGVLVDVSTAENALLDLLESLELPLILVAGPQDESELLLRAMRLGAREFFAVDPSQEALTTALRRLHQPTPTNGEAPGQAPVISVMGSKGGVGATFLAVQLSAYLQKLGGSTVVVDLNLAPGDVALQLDVQPPYTLTHLAKEHERLDATSLRTIVHPHRSGLHVLAAPGELENAELVRGDHVESVIRLLRSEFDWVIIDLARSFSDTTIRALDLSSLVLLVSVIDVPTLNHARQHLEVLKKLGHEHDVRTVANRHTKHGDVSARDVVEFMGRDSDHKIPNDFETAALCINHGRLISEVSSRSPLQGSFEELARKIHEWAGVEPAGGEARGLGSRLRSMLGR